MTQTLLTTQALLDLIKYQPKVIFIFDYDGTLVEIPSNPDDAIISEPRMTLINALARKENTLVSIVTGRTLANLKSLVGDRLDPSILRYGSHGAEMGEELKEEVHQEEVKEIKDHFINEEHIYIEEKPNGITIHYRKHPDREPLIARLEHLAGKFHNIFRVQRGHQVFEFLPKQVNKGLAIQDLHNKFPDYYLVFFGDDLTDNYGFKIVNQLNGLSVQVSDRLKEHEAGYLINEVVNLYEFISSYLKI